MAGRRPLPAAPTDDDDGDEYVDPGFEEGEFSDEDYENAKNARQIPEAAPSDDEDYLEPESAVGAPGRPSLPPREPTRGRQPPPSPGPSNGPPAIPPPRGKAAAEGRSPSTLPPRLSSSSFSVHRGNPAQSRAPIAAPPGEIYTEVQDEPPKLHLQLSNLKSPTTQPPPQNDEVYEEPPSDPYPSETYEELPDLPQEAYEDMNESASRPPLPAPMQQQDEYLAPGQAGSDPTEEYSEVPGGVDPNQNRHAPPPPHMPSEDLYEAMNEAADEGQMSSMQKEILGKQLKPSTRELPAPPKPKIQGFQMVGGLDSLRLKGAMGGLRPVARTAFGQRAPPTAEKNDIDPCNVNFHAKAAMFGPTNTLQKKPPPQTIMREDKPSPRSSTGSNKSDSGVVRDLPPDPPTPRQLQNRLAPPSPEQTEAATTKTSLSSRPLPNVPDVPDTKNLSGYLWFFDNILRQDASAKIEAMHVNGGYLVRNSTKDPNNPYTLSVFYKRKVWHLHIRIRGDGKFAIGSAKQDEECFANVPELIDYHTEHSIILAGQDGGETRLIRHPPK